MSVRITAEWTICVVNGVSHTAFLLEVFVFRDACGHTVRSPIWKTPKSSKNVNVPCLGRNPEGSSGLWLENFRGYCGSPQCSFSRCRSNWMGVSIRARRMNFPRTHLRLWFTVMICCNWPFIRKQHMIWTVHRFLGIWARLLHRSPKTHWQN